MFKRLILSFVLSYVAAFIVTSITGHTDEQSFRNSQMVTFSMLLYLFLYEKIEENEIH